MSENKFELIKLAKSLLSQDPEKSYKLFCQAWDKCRNKFDEWDAFYLIRSMKLSKNFDSKLLRAVYDLFNQSNLVTSNMQWLLYDRSIKGVEDKELRRKINQVEKILNVGFQKNFSATDDDYACPYTFIVFKMIDAFDEKSLNNAGENMVYWLDKLDPNKLSKKPNERVINGEEQEFSSPYEKYYSKITKALFDCEEYDLCKENCELALNTIQNFHNNNDLWIKRRLGLSLYHRNDYDTSVSILKSLLNHPPTNKWFVKAEIAECYLKQKKYKSAIQFGCEAALDEKSYSYKIGLFKTLSEAFLYEDDEEVSRYHALLIKSILVEEEWGEKEVYNELFNRHNIFENEVIEFKKILKLCKEKWISNKFEGQEKRKGTIKVIHGSGKSGHVIDDEGNAYFFAINDVQSKKSRKNIYEGSSVEFYLKEATNQDGKPEKHATNIVVKKWQVLKNESNDLEVGAVHEGVVKTIKEYGIFVTITDYNSDGLVHKSSLEESGDLDYLKKLSKNDRVEIMIKKITHKGPDLKIVKVYQ